MMADLESLHRRVNVNWSAVEAESSLLKGSGRVVARRQKMRCGHEHMMVSARTLAWNMVHEAGMPYVRVAGPNPPVKDQVVRVPQYR